jgi:hypothetical protein
MMPEFNWQRLVEMAPLIAGALKPGSPEAGAMMQGYLQSAQALEKQQRDTQQGNLQTRNILSLLEQRRQQMTLEQEGSQRANLMAFLGQGEKQVQSVIGPEAQEMPGALMDPEATQKELLSRLTALAAQFKVPAGATTALMPQNLPQVSKAAVSRRARAFIKDWESRPNVKNLDPEDRRLAEQKFSVGTPGHEFFDKSIPYIRGLAEAELVSPTGEAMPLPARTTGTREERAEQLIGRIRAAKEAGDTAAVTKYERQYEDFKQSLAATRASASGLTPIQEFNASERLATAWTKEQSAAREMERQYALMTTGLKRFREGDTLGGSQAVLVTFQKILDPTSVVRESEYARTAEGLAVLDRLEGMYQRLKAGGAGVPDKELAEIVQTAKEFLDNTRARSGGVRRRIEAAAAKYGLDLATIVDDVLMGTPSPDTGAPPPPDTGAPPPPETKAPPAQPSSQVGQPLPDQTPEQELKDYLRRRDERYQSIQDQEQRVQDELRRRGLQ